jgi:glutamate racemase
VPADERPIALFDSGLGGLSILREVHRQFPNENLLYFADQAHVPYGPRPLLEIRAFAEAITRFLLDQRARAIIVACNAASAASLHHLRAIFPGVSFVGMEPAVKPAAESTRNGIIGVITTQATYQGELFASVIGRFAQGVEVVTQVCPEFVTLVEEGQLDTPHVHRVVEGYLRPLMEAGIDQLVLGCTHFPFLVPVLADVVGPGVSIVDPSPAVARQVGRLIANHRNAPEAIGQATHFTSGDPATYRRIAGRLLLLGTDLPDESVQAVTWREGRVTLTPPDGQ